MNIDSWYSNNFESQIAGRYVTTDMIIPVLNSYASKFKISVIGTSEEERPIHLIRIGEGEKVVFGWSQMHGNESTTTKALFDFMKFMVEENHFRDKIQQFLNSYSFYCIPILNPDGAFRYTRLNSNEVDLNRDAVNLSQKESRVLREAFDRLQPHICLNLHGQRTMYGLENGKSSTISFLAPAADEERSIIPARREAMRLILKMANTLESIIPGQIGRYDDTFNANCVGDTFQSLEVPTILFEAGHFGMDYGREYTRELLFYSLLSLFELDLAGDNTMNYPDYSAIPENKKNFKDIIIRNAKIGNREGVVDLGIQFEEQLMHDKINFVSVLEVIGDSVAFYGHKEIDIKGEEILVNSHENVFVGDKISTITVKRGNTVIFSSE